MYKPAPVSRHEKYATHFPITFERESNMNKITTLTSALALGLAATGGVQAANQILFDPDGSGPEGTILLNSFDWTPDNALALDTTPQQSGDTFQINLQAALGNFLDINSDPILGTGLGTDYEITFQSIFYEEAVLVFETLDGGVNANYKLAASQPTNYFTIYWDDLTDASGTHSNLLTGEGYADGIPILTAAITKNTTTFYIPYEQDFCIGSCADGILGMDGVLDTAAISNLDQSDTNQQPRVGTVEGSGGGTLEALVSTQNSDFFLDPMVQLIVDLFFNSSQVVPFKQVDPTGPITCTAGVVGECPNLANSIFTAYDLINGIYPILGCEDGTAVCDFLFQADANQSFSSVRVPEPSIIALLGLGLGALGIGSRRRRRQS